MFGVPKRELTLFSCSILSQSINPVLSLSRAPELYMAVPPPRPIEIYPKFDIASFLFTFQKSLSVICGLE